MTTVLSIRLPSAKIAELDRRAVNNGMDRSEYVRQLIEQALETKTPSSRRKFASMDLRGRYAIRAGSDNAAVRAALAARRHK
jgi:metal-responsive CopG/Arc/MetJ family transcriptional regulator